MRFILQLMYILILFQLVTLNAYSTSYYIDKDASGSNNGTSWTNAWQSFSNINWTSIVPGDIIFISGGTDSTIYFERLVIGKSGAPGNYITIRNSYDSGHNGKVIIEDPNTNSFDGCIYMSAKDWVYVKGIETKAGIRACYLYTQCDYVTIDSCIFKNWYPNGFTGGLKIEGNDNFPDNLNCTNIEIKNCIISSTSLWDASSTDCIYVQGALNTKIHHNFIHQKNHSLINHHVDCIQMYRTAGVKIWNNICIVDSGVTGHGMILGIESRSNDEDTMICYNNYVYVGGHEYGGDPDLNAVFNRWYGYNYPPLSYWIHNTLVTKNSNESPIVMEYMGFLKNNIIVQFGTNGQQPSWPLPTINAGNSIYFDPPCYVDSCTNNLIWREWGDVQFYGMFSGNGHSGSPSGWSGWVNTYGGTGVNSNPSFKYPLGSFNGFILNSNSPANNAGGNLKAFVESKGLPWTDILGNTRDNSPNIGAYETESATGSDGNSPNYPATYTLFQNFPNPFNPVTTIMYNLPNDGPVQLEIIDVLGRRITTLVNEYQNVGSYKYLFDASALPSGVYIYKLHAGDFVSSKKMLLLK